jgi:DNA primase
VLKVVAEGQTVFVVEGEKDADNLNRLGLIATTKAGGAGKWKKEYSEALRGGHVVILPDNDEAGRQHTSKVVRSLQRKAASVKIISLPGLPPKGDVSDWLAAGGTREQLEELVRALQEVQKSPGGEPDRDGKEEKKKKRRRRN